MMESDVVVVERSVRAARAPSRGVCEAAVALGVSLDRVGEGACSGAGAISLGMGAGSAVLIEGASGSGKSTLMLDVRAAVESRGWVVIGPESRRLGTRATVEMFGRDVGRAMRSLARAGLGEAGVFVRRADELSEGQRARLRLALAMERARVAAGRGRDVVLMVDEMGSGLDRVTAAGLARLVGRMARETPGVRAVVATTRDDLCEALGATTRVSFDALGRARVERVWGRLACGAVTVRIVEGTMDEYRALAGLHYRGGAPATAELVLAAREVRGGAPGDLAGVMVVSRPVLNASWRGAAWGERFSSGDRRADARRVNEELRCVSRVVVEPRYRSLGIARGMVGAYLARPLTRCTEAVAAMGGVCPFFCAAGMREVRVSAPARDARLVGVLARAGVEGWRMALPRAAWGRVEGSGLRDEVERELRVWANGSRGTRGLLGGSVESMFEAACCRVSSRGVAYVHEVGDGGGTTTEAQRAQRGEGGKVSPQRTQSLAEGDEGMGEAA